MALSSHIHVSSFPSFCQNWYQLPEVRLALIVKLMKIDAKVLELVLKCTESKLNHAI
jgi:hypothetical protein